MAAVSIPPAIPSRSNTVTRCPSAESEFAAVRPAGPAPMTAMRAASLPAGTIGDLAGRNHAVDHKALQRPDSDRLASGRARTANLFARMMANAGTGGRERVGFADHAVGVVVLAARDVRHIAPDLGADRAAVLAGRSDQVLARPGRAAALENMRFIFIAEPLAACSAPDSAPTDPVRTGWWTGWFQPASSGA